MLTLSILTIGSYLHISLCDFCFLCAIGALAAACMVEAGFCVCNAPSNNHTCTECYLFTFSPIQPGIP